VKCKTKSIVPFNGVSRILYLGRLVTVTTWYFWGELQATGAEAGNGRIQRNLLGGNYCSFYSWIELPIDI